MSPEELLGWADAVRQACEAEEANPYHSAEFIEKIMRELPPLPPAPLPPGIRLSRYDCGCPLYGTCMNTVCPRRVQFTSGTLH